MSTQAIVTLVASSITAFFIALRQLLMWGLTQWKEQQVDTRASLDRSTKAMTEHAVASREVALKLDTVVDRLDRIEFRVEELTPVGVPIPRRPGSPRTPSGGVPIGQYSMTKRGPTHGG